MTFDFVDRLGCSVELVWAQDSALYRDSSSSGFGWTPSRLLPFIALGELRGSVEVRRTALVRRGI